MEIKEILKKLKSNFEERTEVKNSWGKNEIRDLFRECLTEVLIDILNEE